MKLNIVVVNYGLGNIHSVSKALSQVAPEASVLVSNKPEDLRGASHVVFPGVGAIKDCIQPLQSSGLGDAIAECRQPLLGICVGMQALFDYNEESGGVRSLGIIGGQVRRFRPQHEQLKVPHMGWNQVQISESSGLFAGIANGERFYFVHSYYCEPEARQHTLASCDYCLSFAAAVRKDNFYGVQFHPEKSSRAGLQLLANFLKLS